MTNEERREVARRLRELHLGGGSKDLIERTLSDAIGAWRRSGMSWDFITERLADLIDPGEDVSVSAYDLLSKEERRALNRWPRFDDGAPVWFGDEFIDHQGIVRSVFRIDMWQEGGFALYTGQGTKDWHSAGEPAKRPAVPAADGEPLEVGQTVWHEDGTELRVLGVGDEEDGETIVRVEYVGGPTRWGEVRSLSLTHAKPEPPDTWERIEEDARGLDSGVDRELFTHTHEDIVRRCKALAGVSE